MPIMIREDEGDFDLIIDDKDDRLVVPFADLPALLAAHRCQWEPPERLETCGAALVRGGFQPQQSKRFATAVIRWGGGHRLVGRFDEKNADQAVADGLRAAYGLIEDDNVPAAVGTVSKFAYIGQAFASKLVRFLAPNKALILDSVIRSKLRFPETVAGYNAFLQDCLAVQAAVAQCHPNFRACDIEAAIYAKLQGY